MKLGLLLLIVAIVLGGLIGTLVVRDPGYVLISYDDMAVETSLWLAVTLLLLIYLVIRAVMFVFSRSWKTRDDIGGWVRQKRSRSARQHTVQGLLLMAEGQWTQARKLLVTSAEKVSSPLINYLNAARAAHELGDTADRDELLRKAHESTPGSRFAVGLTQAQLQMSAGQWEQCLATVLQLRSDSPRHPQVLSMLWQCYQQLADWQALIELLPDLRRRKILDNGEFETLQLEAWGKRLQQCLEAASLIGLWKEVPKEIRRSVELVAIYASALGELKQGDEAERVLRSALQHSWDDSLITLYGTVVSDDASQQLVAAEGWIKERPNDPDLLLALGRISMMNHQWAKAREYLETSLRLKRTPAVYGVLGRLCSALGDTERGSEYLSQALDQSLRNGKPLHPEMPLPSRA